MTQSAPLPKTSLEFIVPVCNFLQARKLPGADRGVELRRIDVTQYMGLTEALADQ